MVLSRVVQRFIFFFGLLSLMSIISVGVVFSNEVQTDSKTIPSQMQNVKPVTLEKLMPALPLEKKAVKQSQPGKPILYRNMIESCVLSSMNGNQMKLILKFQLDPNIKQPVYNGAFLYDAAGKAINAGYMPNIVQTLPKGETTVTMVLPKTAFHSDTVDAFLIQNGKIIVSEKFRLVFSWNGHAGQLAGSNKVSTPSVSKQSFCRAYAEQAAAQYRFGKQNNVQGIFGPAWSDDIIGHYQWCMSAPGELTVQEHNRRKDHLKNNLPSTTPGLSELLGNDLDPGRGP